MPSPVYNNPQKNKRKPMKAILLFLLACLALPLQAQTEADSVTIRGCVTDFQGLPLDSTTVLWQGNGFSIVAQTLTGKDGRYTIRLLKGKYPSMAAVNFQRYLHTAPAHIAEADKRLEFWGWDFIADRDTTLDIRYHRMEVYGLRAFRIPGSVPAYQLFFQPQGLTRMQKAIEEHPELLMAGKDLSKTEQQPLAPKALYLPLGPAADRAKITVWIDGEEVKILHKQSVTLYMTDRFCTNAYLLTVDRPKQDNDLPYHVFRVELEDLDNGDRGEGIYYLEKETYVTGQGN